jgi:DNA-binding NtrC family response regulator
LPLQPKLLRVLQEREFDRLGETRPTKVDLRVIATTNRALETMVEAGEFRADLYYRLNVIPLTLPPLRERREDIAELAEHFLGLYAPAHSTPGFSPDFRSRLEHYSWPGNVRELANLIRRAVVLCPGEIGAGFLEAFAMLPASPPPAATKNTLIETGQRTSRSTTEGASEITTKVTASEEADRLRAGVSLAIAEKRLLEVTLEATAGNRSRAAEMLGVSLRTVRNKIRDYGLPPKRSYAND